MYVTNHVIWYTTVPMVMPGYISDWFFVVSCYHADPWICDMTHSAIYTRVWERETRFFAYTKDPGCLSALYNG